MISASWLTPEVVRTLGWTLVHFLWEGAALALLFYIFLAFTRSARVRYAAGVVTLALMTAAPIATFAFLQDNPAPAVDGGSTHQVIASLQVAAKLAIDNSVGPVHAPLPSIDWLTCTVWAWFGGVLVFALRALGGWILLERLHREKSEPLAENLGRRCLQLQERLGLNRTVRYIHTRLVGAPAVMGWFRPVVLIPVTALTGLSPQQLEAVIAHELAHIKRLDCFVNLFQIAAETVLFYHPAIWWVSNCVRTERENCCDDVAVSVCGNAGDYARALTVMETWRATPALVLAANGASLRSRVGRLLGVEAITRSIPRGGLAAVGVLCAAGALFATTTANRLFTDISDSEASTVDTQYLPDRPAAPAVPAIAYSSMSCSRVERRARVEHASMIAMASNEAHAGRSEDAQSSQTADNGDSKESYIAGLQAAGLKDLSVDQIVRLKIQDVTPDYIREMRAAGFDTSIDNLISMKVQGITPEYAKEMRATGIGPNTHDLIAMKIQGITPEYVKEIRAAGLNPNTHDLIALKVQGVTPEYLSKVRSEYGNDVTVHQIIAMKIQDVDPAQAAEFKRLGLDGLSLNKLIAFKVQGVTPDYIRGLQAAGFKDLRTSDVLAAKIQGVTPEFIQNVRSHGFTNLNIHQLIELKAAGVF
jgi:beta-lactamase regulating signal transducer with metallopeptidase domain